MLKPESKDLSHLLSEEAKSRNPSPLKQAFKYFGREDVIYLGGGLPLAENFPFSKIGATSINPPFNRGIAANPTAEDALEYSVQKPTDDSGDINLQTSLQYGGGQGNPKMLEFIKEHTRLVHNVAYKDWDVIVTVGNTQGWDATLRTFTNRGDTILTEEFTFSSSVEAAHSLGLKVVPVKMDLNGVIPEAFAEQLDSWVGPKPKIFYSIPTGQNPTGSTLSLERRKKIYEVCQKHDIILVEDEPYYFLQMPQYKANAAEREQAEHTPSHKEFLESLVPSFLDIDTDGRVVRLDSFSKVVAPGCRLGWIVAQERIIERYLRQNEVTIQVASGFAETLVYGLLKRWGQEGYLDWLIGVRKAYTSKRDAALDAMEKFLPKELCDFIAPEAGMFFWIKVDGSKHPKYEQYKNDPLGLEMEIYESGIKAGVLLVPGHWFLANDQTNPPQKYQVAEEPGVIFFRGTYAAVPEPALVKALELYGDHIRKEFGL
ncbi:aromatic/aminoadipate aminotransferase 1 [Trichomonascus vanleenenianus]|uniref:bifunctional 2-aminoadipate transaminase/aromatic-amino-acid:2-oxoglutarate transaminase n=1 Tax=Trichomonascus vanleenenianus TaxID=2268995 RepID=UPI003ECB0135